MVNENRNPPLVEDWQSILSVIPGALWVQAADETDLWAYMAAQAEERLIDRWYKHAPTDAEIAAAAAIERAWARSQQPPARTLPLAHRTKQVAAWRCDTCSRQEIPGDSTSEPYAGDTCGRCVFAHRTLAWDC